MVALYFNVRIRVRGNAPRTRFARQQPKNFLSFFCAPPQTPLRLNELGKEVFGLLSLCVTIYNITYHGIFHNRIYHDNIVMTSKYRVKYQKFINQLRKARLEAELTQVDVGKKLKKPQAYVSKIERGERRVDVVELEELARLYKQPLDYFI